MVSVSWRRRRVCRNVMRAFIMRNRNQAAPDIGFAFMRQRDAARAKAGEQQKRDTGTLDPRRTAEHRTELSYRDGRASSNGDRRLPIQSNYQSRLRFLSVRPPPESRPGNDTLSKRRRSETLRAPTLGHGAV